MSATAAPTAVVRQVLPVVAGTVPAPVAAGTVAAAYDPAAAASATAALASAAAAAAAGQRDAPANPAAVPAPTMSASLTSVPAAPAPPPAAAAAPVAAATTSPIAAAAAASAAASPAAARALLQRFVSTYESADLRGFMALFAPDARENRGGIAAIREDYGQLFAGSDLRRLQLYDVRIVPAAYGMLDVRVRYQAGVLMHGAPAMADYSGVMRMVMRPEPQGLRIIQLLRSGEVESRPDTPQ